MIRLTLVLAGVLLFAAPLAGQDALDLAFEVEALREEGLEHLTAKRYDEAVAAFERIVAKVEAAQVGPKTKRSHLANARYNQACAQALAGRKAEALEAFAAAVENRFWGWEHIAQDRDLDAIREDPAFAAAIARGKAAEQELIAAEVRAALDALREAQAGESLVPGFDLDLETTTGERFRLADQRGKVVLVAYFWPAIGDERGVSFPSLKRLERLRATRAPEELAVLGVAMKVNYDPDGSFLAEFVTQRRLGYPVARVDPQAMQRGMPLLVIDAEGAVRARLKEPRYEVIEAVTRALLEARTEEGGPPR